jgi:hypothetical protein
MILLKTLRSSFESLRACPEFIEGTNGGAVEIIGDFSVHAEPVEAFVDSNHRIVKQNEFKKFYRAKHAKLAKAPPTRPFFIKLCLGVLGVLCARSNLFRSSRNRKNSNMFG